MLAPNKARLVSGAYRVIMYAFLKNQIEGNGPQGALRHIAYPQPKSQTNLDSDKKHELLTRSLRKMEKTLDTVLRSIGNPGIASGMVSRSPSPSAQNADAQAMLGPSPSPPPVAYPQQAPTASPKLHSLPDNSLNPLGLLAEASLANRRSQMTYMDSGLLARPADPNEKVKVGVASANYFKPGTSALRCLSLRNNICLGPMTILPLRRLYIERQIQPEMLNFVSRDEVVALFDMYVPAQPNLPRRLLGLLVTLIISMCDLNGSPTFWVTNLSLDAL